MNSDEDLVDIIRLIRTPNIGPITFFKLLDQFKTESNVIKNLPSLLPKNSNFQPYSKQKALEEVDLAKSKNINIISYKSPYYPPLLHKIDNKPPILFVKGNINLLKKSSIAIVGSRNCSLNGKNIASKFAKELGEHGFLVVSGLAKGIDASAHMGSLQSGTVAFLGGGVDVIYPLENKSLYDKIAQCGAIVSEFPIGSAPIASNFPKRNRLISGMSKGILVVEATQTSGSIITANIALSQGREVFAIPGSPFDGKSSGTNYLIQQGAILTQNISDIIDNLQHFIIKESQNNKYEPQNNLHYTSLDENILDNAQNYLLSTLSASPISINTIIEDEKFTYQEINTAILRLELLGKVIRYPNNQISLIVNIN